MLPNGIVTRVFLLRGTRYWLLTCIAFVMVLLQAKMDPLATGLHIVVPVVLLVAALGLVQITRRRERFLLGNLAIPMHSVLAVTALPAVIGEVGLSIVLW
jgi:hypothetical protein